MTKPPITATLVWSGGLRFSATCASHTLTFDSDAAAGPTPPQTLAMGLAGCMAIDVVDILGKGRHPLSALTASITGHRLDDPPRRFTRFRLHFSVTGEVPTAAIERAIQLSRDKYCSVFHSLRPDVELDTTFEVLS